jgi:hypothetical protein
MGMTSTLLQTPSTELQLLTWSRQLQTVRFNEYTALGYLSNAVHKVRTAQSPESSPALRLHTSCDGIFSAFLGMLYLHGLRPCGKEGYRALVIQLGSEMLQLTPTERDQILHASHVQQLVTNGSPPPLDTFVAQVMPALGQRTLVQARKIYPDWFL